MKIEDLLQLARKYGVSEFTAATEDAGQVRVTLGEQAQAVAARVSDPFEHKELERESRENQVRPKVGLDGLTATQQADLYMMPMSDTASEVP